MSLSAPLNQEQPPRPQCSGRRRRLLDSDLSEDEDLAPDQPAFVGLFKPAVFRSLLFKAKKVTRLGLSQGSQDSTSDKETMDPLSLEPAIEKKVLPPGYF